MVAVFLAQSALGVCGTTVTGSRAVWIGHRGIRAKSSILSNVVRLFRAKVNIKGLLMCDKTGPQEISVSTLIKGISTTMMV